MDMPKTCAAAILVEQRKPLVVDEIELPEKLEAGQVMVRVYHSGICGSQLGEIDGAKGPDRFLPHLLGHEGSGVVVAVGAGVRYVKPDDHVVLHWRPSLGIEAAPPKYKWKGEALNAGWVTTFNEYAVISENRLTPISPESDMKIASLFGCAVTTGFGVVMNNANVKIGDSVVVFGAGGVGLNIIQAAAMSSAYPIIAVDRFDGRLELAKELGATQVINSTREDAEAQVKVALSGQTLDVFIDNTGNPAIIEMGYQLCGPKGRVVLVGVPAKGKNISVYSLPMHFGKTLIGSHGGEAIPQEDIPKYLSLYELGRLHLDQLITEEYSLDQINDAIARMRDGSLNGRCLINI